MREEHIVENMAQMQKVNATAVTIDLMPKKIRKTHINTTPSMSSNQETSL